MNQAPLPWKAEAVFDGAYRIFDARGETICYVSDKNRTRVAQGEIAARIVSAVNDSAPVSEGGNK